MNNVNSNCHDAGCAYMIADIINYSCQIFIGTIFCGVSWYAVASFTKHFNYLLMASYF